LQICGNVQIPLRYEFPLTERARLLLRLEDSLQRVREQALDSSPDAHRSSLVALCELVELASRIDLKAEVRMELERQRSLLRALRGVAEVDAEALAVSLAELDSSLSRVDATLPRAGARCRDDAWLSMFRTRLAVPGGATRFDLPSFHYWSSREPTARREWLLRWLGDFDCVRNGVAMALHLLRGSASSESQLAAAGSYTRSLGNRVPMLAAVDTSRDCDCIPEITVNRALLTVRFNRFSDGGRPRPCNTDIAFGLAVCFQA
jgi:cell division protein ZapD